MLDEDILALEGVGPSTAKKLISAGYPTVEAIAVSPPQEIMERTGLGFNTVLKIQESARKLMSSDYKTAKEYYEKRRLLKRCTTGSKRLDEILGGGVETQAITEFIGEYGSGKTQICMMLSVTAQLPYERGGLEGSVVFIDTEGTFMPERIYQIASHMGLDPDAVANNILVGRAYNSAHQCLLIDQLFSICKDKNVKLVVVDSMISHFRGEYVGREMLSERQQKLNKYLHKLLRLAEAYNLAVVVTNQVQSDPATYFGDPNRPAGGNIMAHACTHRVFLHRGSRGTRVAKIIDSPYLPERKATFMITEKGITDVEDEDSGRSR